MDTVIPVVGGSAAAAPSTAPFHAFAVSGPVEDDVESESESDFDLTVRPAAVATTERLTVWLRSFGFTGPAVLERTLDRLLADPDLPADDPEAALAHVERRAALWFAGVLGEVPGGARLPAGRVAAAGRAAFLLAGAARRWPDSFLAEDRPPVALTQALRRAVLVAVPEPLPGRMIEQSLDRPSPTELLRRLFMRPLRKALPRSAI